jgi:RNA polymerase sigma-70 factor (ECF subfamily)
MCIKRGGKTQTLSLDQEDENGQTLMDYLADDHCFEDEISIRIDVSKAIDQLPESFQALCEQLKIFTITEVSHMSGRSRAAIYRDLELMRPMFFLNSVYIRRCEQFFPQCGI